VISDKAIVDSNAKIAAGVTISPYAVIGPDVEIGAGTWIGPHVVIEGPTKIGAHNQFFQFSSIGSCPQDKKYKGEPTRLEIGDHNIFRECTTVSRGTLQGGEVTTIGSHNLFMAYVHIAHDCQVGSQTTFANNASLAGHVIVADYASLGGFVGVHQYCQIGAYCFCAAGSIVLGDALPFTIVSGCPAKVHGLNTEGLKRRAFSKEEILFLRRAYKILYRQGLTLDEATLMLAKMIPDCQPIQMMTDFIKKSTRGIVR